MKKSNLIGMILLASMLCAVTTACSDNKGKTPAQTNDKGNTNTPAAETEEVLPYAFAQNGLDFGGYNFRVFTDHQGEVDILLDDLVAGEIVSESVYNRNARVEELLNIEISTLDVGEINWSEISPTVSKYVMAGDDAFDALNAGLIEVFRASSNGHLIPLREIETLDLEADWWDQSIYEAFDFGNGNFYMMNGGINYWDDYGLSCISVNLDLMRRNDLEFPYDAVRAGEWDYEMFHGYIRDFEQDINGNGEWDPEDQYGCLDNLDFGSRVGCGFGMFAVSKNAEGKPEFLLDEAYYERFDKLISGLCKDPSVVIMERKFGYEEGGKMFGYGNILFRGAMVNDLQGLRDSEFMATIVPMPKFDENQEKYLNSARDIYCTAYGVPITNSDFDRTGYILDAMSYFGDQIIRPAAIEKQCMVKGAQDEDTVDMLNIIFDSKAYDLTYITGWGEWYGTMHDFTKSGKNNLSSKEAQNQKRVNRDIEKSLASFGIE